MLWIPNCEGLHKVPGERSRYLSRRHSFYVIRLLDSGQRVVHQWLGLAIVYLNGFLRVVVLLYIVILWVIFIRFGLSVHFIWN